MTETMLDSGGGDEHDLVEQLVGLQRHSAKIRQQPTAEDVTGNQLSTSLTAAARKGAVECLE